MKYIIRDVLFFKLMEEFLIIFKYLIIPRVAVEYIILDFVP